MDCFRICPIVGIRDFDECNENRDVPKQSDSSDLSYLQNPVVITHGLPENPLFTSMSFP